MHNVLIQDLAAILVVGAVFGWIFKKLFRLPLILGYIFGGIFFRTPIPFKPAVLLPEIAHNLAEVGILLLLFSMGLHFGVRKIKTFGFSTIFVGVFQALSMWFTGKYVFSRLGFGPTESIFLGAALSNSATSVIIKTIEDFQLKSHRFAEKLMGVLLVEDAVAIFILIWLAASAATHSGTAISIWNILPIFLGSLFIWWVLGTILIPRLIRMALETGREELLVILSVGLALGLAYVSAALNFSAALGAFVMGSILSECREIRKIETLIEPVKNIFCLIFFVSIGLLFSAPVVIANWTSILILVLVVFVGKILYNLVYNLVFGRELKDALLMSGSMGQIGEMSFVMAQLGKTLGVINDEMFSMIVAVAVITILMTPLTMRLFSYFADKSENLIKKKPFSYLETYSHSLFLFSLDKKIYPLYKKISVSKCMHFITKFIKDHVHKNYLLATSHNVSSVLNRLAPWDEYLVPVNVSFHTDLAGKSLMELRLRERFNINIVAISRDLLTIISPKPSDIIMGGDTLLVYGNESAISNLEHCASQQVIQADLPSIDDCILGRMRLEPNHLFVGKSILELGIRNSYNCIILAINRDNERIKNPVSSFVFRADDEVFIFGTKQSIDCLNKVV